MLQEVSILSDNMDKEAVRRRWSYFEQVWIKEHTSLHGTEYSRKHYKYSQHINRGCTVTKRSCRKKMTTKIHPCL